MRITITGEPCPCHQEAVLHLRALNEAGDVVHVVHINGVALSFDQRADLAAGLFTMHVLLHPADYPTLPIQPAPGMGEEATT